MRVPNARLLVWLLGCTACGGPGGSSADFRETNERLAVVEVLSRFAGAVGERNWGGAAELFTEDAVWSATAGDLSFRHEGRAAILAWLTNNVANVEVLFYSSGVPSVTVLADDRARSRVGMTEVLLLKAKGERQLLLGTYVDELAKVNGSWRFTRRHVTVNHAEPLRGTPSPG